MKTYLDCLPCFLKQAVRAAQLATDDPHLQHAAVRAAVDELRGVPADARPVDIAPNIHAAVRRVTSCDDPYRHLKRDSNELALRFVPMADDLASRAADPLLVAARIAAAGNIADAAIASTFDFRAAIRRAATTDFVGDDYEYLKADVAVADKLLYLADNAGEIVFDRLLIQRLNGAKVTVAVKTRPIINDATAEDALAAGIDGHATIIGSGDRWPRPDLADASPTLRAAFHEATVIIAKGQGNYEALSEFTGPIYFLLTAKCQTVAEDLGVAVGDLVLRRGHHAIS